MAVELNCNSAGTTDRGYTATSDAMHAVQTLQQAQLHLTLPSDAIFEEAMKHDVDQQDSRGMSELTFDLLSV